MNGRECTLYMPEKNFDTIIEDVLCVRLGLAFLPNEQQFNISMWVTRGQ